MLKPTRLQSKQILVTLLNHPDQDLWNFGLFFSGALGGSGTRGDSLPAFVPFHLLPGPRYQNTTTTTPKSSPTPRAEGDGAVPAVPHPPEGLPCSRWPWAAVESPRRRSLRWRRRSSPPTQPWSPLPCQLGRWESPGAAPEPTWPWDSVESPARWLLGDGKFRRGSGRVLASQRCLQGPWDLKRMWEVDGNCEVCRSNSEKLLVFFFFFG